MYFIIGVLLVIFTDQISKILVMNNMELGESIPVINNIFHITYIHKPWFCFWFVKFSNKTFIIKDDYNNFWHIFLI